MPTADDLAPLRANPFNEAVEKLEELMTQTGRAFLIGAGCSKCAGLPLMADLTTNALGSPRLEPVTKKILSVLKENFEGAKYPNIEDYLSELVDLLAIADRRALRGAAATTISLGGEDYAPGSLRAAADQIREAIADVIAQPISIEHHWKFARAIHRPVRPGRGAGNPRVEYLVLNYDTLIEDALALEKVTFADGLEGGVTAWWDPTTFSNPRLCARVLKLHGSINWFEFPSEVLPRRLAKFVCGTGADERRIMIWPASTKYRETQRDPYSQLSNLVSCPIIKLN